jgi:hypothetical protein
LDLNLLFTNYDRILLAKFTAKKFLGQGGGESMILADPTHRFQINPRANNLLHLTDAALPNDRSVTSFNFTSECLAHVRKWQTTYGATIPTLVYEPLNTSP